MRLAAVTVLLLALAGAALAANPNQPKKVIIPAVQAKAKAINVKLSDLPTSVSWKAKPASPDSGTPRCSYYNPDQSDLTENGDVNSPELTLPSSSYISSSTSIFKTASQGRTAYVRVVQPKLPKCLAELFKKGVESNGSNGSGNKAQVTILSAAERPFPKLADKSNVYRLVADIKVGKQKIRTVADFVVFNHGKVDTVIFFVGIGGAFNDKFEQSVASKVAARAKSVS